MDDSIIDTPMPDSDSAPATAQDQRAPAPAPAASAAAAAPRRRTARRVSTDQVGGGGDDEGGASTNRSSSGGGGNKKDGSCYWCFTWNNPPDNYEQFIKDLYADDDKDIDYITYGREVGGETETFHLQGFLQVGTPILNSELFNNGPAQRFFQAHWTRARRVGKARRYCFKTCPCKANGKKPEFEDIPCTCGQVSELGAFAVRKGKRSDLDDFKTAVEQSNGSMSLRTARRIYSDVVARYPKFCADYINDHRPIQKVPHHTMYAWQRALYDKLFNYVPHPREVIFVVDKVGNTGKSWFAKTVALQSARNSRCKPAGVGALQTATNPEEETRREGTETSPDTTVPQNHDQDYRHVVCAQYMTPGKFADMAYAICEETTVLFMDCPRARLEMLQYDFVEGVKNGMIFSTKYESRMKFLPRCHVVIFMNAHPDLTQLSSDRYTIMEVDKDLLAVPPPPADPPATPPAGEQEQTNPDAGGNTPPGTTREETEDREQNETREENETGGPGDTATATGEGGEGEGNRTPITTGIQVTTWAEFLEFKQHQDTRNRQRQSMGGLAPYFFPQN